MAGYHDALHFTDGDFRAQEVVVAEVVWVMKNEYLAYGTKRTRQKKLEAGTIIKHEKGVILIHEASVMDVIEVFSASSRADKPGWWWEHEQLFDTIRPAGSDVSTAIVPVKLSIWSRFWAWVRRRPLPVARLVKG